MPEQIGFVDCGLFALAYATALVNGKEITKMSFKQNKMIDHYNHLLYLQQTEELEDFPHH